MLYLMLLKRFSSASSSSTIWHIGLIVSIYLGDTLDSPTTADVVIFSE